MQTNLSIKWRRTNRANIKIPGKIYYKVKLQESPSLIQQRNSEETRANNTFKTWCLQSKGDASSDLTLELSVAQTLSSSRNLTILFLKALKLSLSKFRFIVLTSV